MVRPRLCRRIRFNPEVTYFKPQGIPLKNLEEVNLEVDEFESVRLVDFEEIEQKIAGEKMNISQPTLSRILKSARKKISDAIIQGKAIKIHGGNFKIR